MDEWTNITSKNPMKKTLSLLLTIWGVGAFAGSAVQTDWSGGDGVEGPVTEWNTTFASQDQVSWLSIPGQIALSSLPLTRSTTHVVVEDYNDASCVWSADLDRDGDLDLISTGDGEITWWENLLGTGVEWVRHAICVGIEQVYCIRAADIDGDGDDDVFGAAPEGNIVAWWKNLTGQGDQWLQITIDAESAGPFAVSAGDVDQDGDLDLVGTAYWQEAVVVWWENADGGGYVWVRHPFGYDMDSAAGVQAVDFDKDGDVDVLVGSDGDELAWWENADGCGGTFVRHDIEPIFGDAFSVEAVDVDGDGDNDVMYTGKFYIAWSENVDAQGTEWENHEIADVFWEGYSVDAADLDGDGDVDVAAVDRGMNYICWCENITGDGLTWNMHILESFYNPMSVYTADLDGDGDLDMAVAVEVGDRVVWYEITVFRPSGELVSSVLDTGVSAAWGPLTWTAGTPEGTSLAVAVRASDDYGQMGEWSDVPTSGTDLTGIIPDGLRYFQYKVSLSSSVADASPILWDITLEWEDESGIGDAELAASPTSEGILVEWGVTGDRPVGFRLLRQSAGGEPQPVHEGYLPGRAAGYLDRGAAPGVEYVYWLEVFEGRVGEDADLFGPTEAVSIPEAGLIPSLSVYPNPADESLTVVFLLPGEGRIELAVYDLAGRRVASLDDGVRPAGRNDVRWDCADAQPGVYLCVLKTAWGTLSRRLVIAR
jgi:hypothetical protein